MPAIRLQRLRRRAAGLAVLAAALGAGAGGAVPSAAQAAVLSTHVFSYADMPDIDQGRIAGYDASGSARPGLPGDGAQYCMPAAAMDALAFIAQHGASDLSPGAGNWTAPGSYDTMSLNLGELGGLMGTDANNGTTVSGLQNGLAAWNARHGTAAHSFSTVSEYPGFSGDSQPPNLGIALLTEAVNNPVIFNVGYYGRKTIRVGGQSVSAMVRTGGHEMVMTGWDGSTLNFNDPADAPAGFAQSAYRPRSASLTPAQNVYANEYTDATGKLHDDLQQPAQAVDGLTVYPQETYWKMSGWDAPNAYIEGYTIIQPSFQLRARRSVLDLVRSGIVRHYALLGGADVADVQASPAGDAAYYAMKGSATVYRLDLGTGNSAPLATASGPVRSLAVDTAGATVYAAAGRQVSELSSTGGVIRRTLLPAPVDAVSFDAVHRELDAVSGQARRVSVLGAALSSRGAVALGGAALDGAPRLTAAINAASGRLEIQRGDTGAVVSASLSITRSRLGSLRSPRSTIGLTRLAGATSGQLTPDGSLMPASGRADLVRRSQNVTVSGPNAQLGNG